MDERIRYGIPVIAPDGGDDKNKEPTEAEKLSIQQRARLVDDTGGGLEILPWLARGGNELIAPWWSKRRDRDLRAFWKQSDHLSGAVYTLEEKIATLPFHVEARDMTVKAHVRQALDFEQMLYDGAEFGGGWNSFIVPGIEDLLTQDNGWFAEVIGPGDANSELAGAAVSVAHLDSWRCTRTKSPEFPVVYQDEDGRYYKLHRTRVIFASQMSASALEMRGVGFCATSRCVNVAQNLIDIMTYKQEKMGSRPPRQMLIGSKGITAADIMTAFRLANEQMDNSGLGRYARTVVIAPNNRSSASEISIQQIDLASVPDGFDEQTSVTLGMFAIALAFGVDARELWPASSSGATKADAMIQAMKARGKGVGGILQLIERQFNSKVLPPQLQIIFDLQDDEQDREQAEIRGMRSERHDRDVANGVLTTRVVREQMLNDGDVTDAQFAEMELDDGRLEDGSEAVDLFFVKNDGEYMRLLDVGVADPFDVRNNDRELMLAVIEEKTLEARQRQMTASTAELKRKARNAIAALVGLRKLYEKAPAAKPVAPESPPVPPMPGTEIVVQPVMPTEGGGAQSQPPF